VLWYFFPFVSKRFVSQFGGSCEYPGPGALYPLSGSLFIKS